MNKKKENIVIGVSIIGSFASISGISILSFFDKNQPIFHIFFGVLLIIGLISIIILTQKVKLLSKLLHGYEVKYEERSKISSSFALSTLRSVYIFGGDINRWLINDLAVYKELIDNRNVEIKILLDNPKSEAIKIGKECGMKFRFYPYKLKAPIKGCLFDTENESDCRALIVRKKPLPPSQSREKNYNYWFKEYYGQNDSMIINGLKSHFELLFSKGKEA